MSTIETQRQNEFIVVQGVVDLAVLLPEEIWLIDFKTDRVAPKQIAARAQEYEPQIRLYAGALSRIYCRPVSGCWLYFLTQKKSVPISLSFSKQGLQILS